MISSMLPTATTLGLFISVFILIAPDGIVCLSTLYVEGDTSIRISCKHDVPDHEFHRVKWFKSTKNDAYENGPPALVSWDNTSDPIISNGNYSIDVDFSLVIHNTSNATGIYRCSVTRNVPGDVVQYDVKVISYGKVNPAHTLPVHYGQHLRIPCSSDSTRDGKVSVVWFKGESRDSFKSDDQPIASSIDGHVLADYSLNDDFSLNIQNASTEYEAVYRSIVVSTKETRPSASDTYVTVYEKVKRPHLSQVKHGEPLKIPCSSNSTRANKVAVLWYKRNSTDILNSDEQPIASWIDGWRHVFPDYTLNDDFSLDIENVSIEYEGVYRSIVVSTQETRPSVGDTYVTVYEKVKRPHLSQVKHGEPLKIPCSSNSTRANKVAVLWYKRNSTDILNSDEQPIASWIDGWRHVFPDYTLNDDFSLDIENVSIEYEGVYRSIVLSTQETRPSASDTYVTVYGEVKPFHPSPVQYGAHLRIPCSYNSPRASGRVSVLWYKRESRDCFKSDDQPIASSIDGRRYVLEDFTLNDDFSLEIQNVSNAYEAVYRSIVVSTQETRRSASDTYVTVYALPREIPLIRHSFVNGSFIINCSVDHVYPLLFPKLNFLSSSQTYGIQNEDGTFNTSVSLNVIHIGHSITLECSFPYFNYTGKSSLLIPANSTDENEGLLPTVLGVVLSGIGLITVAAVVIRKMHTKQHQQKDEKMSTPEMERMV